MNLLLNARRKQRAQHGTEPEFDEQPNRAAAGSEMLSTKNLRDAGQNLFSVKLPGSAAVQIANKRNWLFALCGTILLLATGYYWHATSENSAQPSKRNLSAPTLLPPLPAHVTKSAAAETAATAPIVGLPKTLPSTNLSSAQNKALPITLPSGNKPIHFERQNTALADMTLNMAYLAYRNNDLDTAQRLYREMLGKDARNTDAWLGLAVIAQQHGEDELAAQYYSRALALDPRNAVAHAGMLALTANDGDEQHLKILLDGQQGSAVLHFALGNRYAGQSRWDEAQQSYFNAYTLEPGNTEFAFNLAVSLDHLDQHKLAAQYYQRALQLDQVNIDQPHRFDHAQTEQRVRELSR